MADQTSLVKIDPTTYSAFRHFLFPTEKKEECVTCITCTIYVNKAHMFGICVNTSCNLNKFCKNGRACNGDKLHIKANHSRNCKNRTYLFCCSASTGKQDGCL